MVSLRIRHCLNALLIKYFDHDRGNVMSALLRSLLLVGFAGLLMVGCGEKEEVAPADEAAAPVTTEAAPAAEAPAAAESSSAPATGGGYEPTAEERVPGITIDPAAPVEAAPAAEAPTAPAGTEAPAAP